MNSSSDVSVGTWVKLAAVAVILMTVLAGGCSSYTEIATGHVGIVTQYSAATGTVLQPGLHFITPFVQSVVEFDTHQQKLDVTKPYTSHDQQLIPSDATVTYQVNAQDVPPLYRNVGADYADLAVVPNTDQALNLTIGRYTAEELSTQKQNVANFFQNTLQSRLKQYNINVVNVKLTTTYPDQYQQAIELKQVAQQAVLTAQQQLDQKRIDSQQLVVEAQNKAAAQIAIAKGNAASTLLNAQAASQAQAIQAKTLTPGYLQLQSILAWNGILPQYSSVPIPFLSLPSSETPNATTPNTDTTTAP